MTITLLLAILLVALIGLPTWLLARIWSPQPGHPKPDDLIGALLLVIVSETLIAGILYSCNQLAQWILSI
ncbi:hypothetical protein [Bifidobacterium callimiconis]|uniref:Uncharacterized protein n=1 Tax=Bifidobacterium callimiconis TaxID=2306973 RepID=A0A430FIE4_9BIFI|nr:hypothetical protein [Bifidobacterium callimiconis]RSX52665.1 hypothetical protein D2E23_0393 [Bifidobacterium callimiconis]